MHSFLQSESAWVCAGLLFTLASGLPPLLLTEPIRYAELFDAEAHILFVELSADLPAANTRTTDPPGPAPKTLERQMTARGWTVDRV